MVAFDAKRAFCNNTGLGNYSRTITKGIASQHPDISILLLTPSIKAPHRNHCAEMPNVQVVEPQGLWRAFKSLWRTIGCGLKENPVDIYHGLSQELPLSIPKGVKSVVTIHDMMPWRYPKNFPLFDRMVYKTKVRHACHIADRIVAVSEQTKSDIVKFLNVQESKIDVVYQSCEHIFRQTVTDDQRKKVREQYQLPDKYIICIGTIERRKNQTTLVKAMQKVDKETSLVIVGRKTGYCDEVEKEINHNGLQRRVRIIDNARFEDFPALYAEAIASAYVSLFEGFGIPVLESLCCRTPVVTSNVSSMPEVGGEAALYVDPSNPDDIADKINTLLSDTALREKLISNGRQQIQRFSPENITSDMFRLYQSLV